MTQFYETLLHDFKLIRVFFLPKQNNRQRKSARKGAFLLVHTEDYFFLATTRTISKHCLA